MAKYTDIPENVPRFLKKVFHIPEGRHLELASLLVNKAMFFIWFCSALFAIEAIDGLQIRFQLEKNVLIIVFGQASRL